ncbi:MAG: hypothetical protein E4G99_12280 [Anaerolineales bacterium]|nr:MAG: hypothetical protein E4G99_12280 [Anaerolineales bacterium]
MDDQFYLDWHANYNDTTIIANEEGGFEAFEAVNFFDDPETDELTEEESSYYLRIKRVESKISELNYTPSVVMEDENAVVRFIVFTQWGGFMEVIASIKRSFPHEIVDWKQRTRILYFSGVMY